MSNRCGVLLVGHGTRDGAGTEQFFLLADLLRAKLSPMPIAPCLLEFQQPTIPEAWAEMVAGGVTHIQVAPLLLFAAGHAKQDIPEIVRQCQQETPEVSFSMVRPISRHRAIIDLVCQHLSNSLSEQQTTADQTVLLMVGRGSHDPCAQADMRVLSELVSHRLKPAITRTAFYAMAQPRFDQVLENLASNPSSNSQRTILVHPHLLFEGRLFQSIENIVEACRQRHPKQVIRLSRYLGPNVYVAEAIAGRIKNGVDTSGAAQGLVAQL